MCVCVRARVKSQTIRFDRHDKYSLTVRHVRVGKMSFDKRNIVFHVYINSNTYKSNNNIRVYCYYCTIEGNHRPLLVERVGERFVKQNVKFLYIIIPKRILIYYYILYYSSADKRNFERGNDLRIILTVF